MTEAKPKRSHAQLFQGLFSATDVAGISRWTYALLALLLILSTLWVMTAQLSSAVIINGSVKVYKNKLTLQHPEGGKIEAVHVQDGTRVREGQTLLTLSNPQLASMVRGLERQIFSEKIRAARLQAEMAYPNGSFYPDTPGADNEQLAIIATEKTLFEARLRNIQSQESSVRQQITHVKAEISALQRSLQNDNTILDRTRDLAQQGFVSSANALTAEQTINQRQVELARAQQRVAELEQRLPILVDDFRNNAALELRAANERILDAVEKVRPSKEALNNLDIKAPADGTVVNFTRLGQGAVLGAKEILAELVPTNRGLILEGSLPTEQVAFIRPGMTARVRISQLSKMGFDDFEGTLSTISADSVSQGMLGTSAYMVQVDMGQLSPEVDKRVRPGMPVEIYIQTGSRTPFEYLSQPITDFINKAARE